jgi:hypothetical protein
VLLSPKKRTVLDIAAQSTARRAAAPPSHRAAHHAGESYPTGRGTATNARAGLDALDLTDEGAAPHSAIEACFGAAATTIAPRRVCPYLLHAARPASQRVGIAYATEAESRDCVESTRPNCQRSDTC